MRLKILIVLILFNILIPIKSSAEILNKAKFENISIEEGLSNEHITSIFQDSRGYMWIGTQDGLNRYDGNIIKKYTCNYNDKNTLSSTYITDIDEDANGNMWVATDNGLDFIVTDTDTVERMKDRQDLFALGNLKITSLLKSNYDENIMWAGTEDGLMKVNTKKGTIEAFYHNPKNSNSLTNSSIICLEEDKDGLLWVGTRQGINIIDKNSKVTVLQHMMLEDELFINDISQDDDDNMWISTKEGIFIYNTRDDSKEYIYQITHNNIKKYNLNGKNVSNVYTFENDELRFNDNFLFNDSKNNTWISSSSGAIKYSKDENKFLKFKKNINYKYALSSDITTCFYEDRNGTIWIGTDKGVNILNENTAFINNYINSSIKNIVSILQQNDCVWVASKYKGIYIYDVKNGDLVYTIYDELNLNERYIKQLFKVNERYMVINTNKGMIFIDTDNFSYTEDLINNNYSSELNYLYADGEDIWIATISDFYSYNINTEQKTYYSENMKDADINPGRIKYILKDNKDENILWLGGINTGLVKYHKQKGVIEKYTNNSSDENSLINDYINCMAFDSLGNLWIGTNIGLSKFDIKTEKFTSYTTAEGLTNNFINSIEIDDNKDIWISTNKGLNRFNIEKDNFTKFTTMDGLNRCQFNLNSSLKLRNGIIIFGSTDGCIYFDIDELLDYKKYENNVVIGDIYIGNNKVIYDGNELVLEYNHKHLYVNYFLPNYSNLNNITYEYMLDGFDSDWIYVGLQSSLDFKSLKPGKYTLKIRARDGHGELTKEENINIRVKNSMWHTPLAYIIYILIILLISTYLFNYVKILRHLVNQKTMRLNNQLEENKRLSKEIIEKEKFKNNYFVNLSHELRTPINIIVSTVQVLNLLSKNKNITHEKFNQYMNIISKSCDNLLRIINDIIDTSKIETGKYKINKKNNDIVYIVEEASLNMSKFIEEKGLSIIIDPDIEEKIISCDETEIERCIINLLGNAVKFTDEGGEIRVYIKEIEKYVEITVEDTGIGISKEDQEFIFKRFSQVEGTAVTKVSSSGIGLTLVKYIIELHGGYIKLESELNKGSKFTLGIPDIAENIEDISNAL